MTTSRCQNGMSIGNSLYMWPKDQCLRAKVIATKPLNWSEEPNTKCRRLAPDRGNTQTSHAS
jgi:hypothetical protein